jgi:hypothetical protein
MIKLSESPAFTDSITESTAEGAAGFEAAGLGAAGFGAAGLGAAGGFCARRKFARHPATANRMSLIFDSFQPAFTVGNSGFDQYNPNRRSLILPSRNNLDREPDTARLV